MLQPWYLPKLMKERVLPIKMQLIENLANEIPKNISTLK
jgi:hypothetical protein